MRPADFLAEDNACGQSLLKLTSRGNAIIAELLRLSEFVPAIFAKSENNTKYAELIYDFLYFKIADQLETKLESNERLLDLDEEIRENYIEILTRFYLVFESIYRYAVDLNRYIEDLEEGTFIQQNLESVLNNQDGRQLLAESLYLFGVMLLTVDSKIDGVVRERILVSYYRYSGRRTSSDSNIDDVCRLLRSTGLTKGKRPPNYPENFFKRVVINKLFVSMLIGRLRADDIYNQIVAFPLPDHRSTALAQQAAILYVCLYFAPEILQNQTSVMREIVDKFFPDNWVISVYMGMTVNLVEAWETYKAAKSALTNVLTVPSLRPLVDRHSKELNEVNAGLVKYINEGMLTKEFILDNTNKVLNALRRCNVVLRWLLLHCAPIVPEWETSKKCSQLRDVVVTDGRFSNSSLFQLLLNTAQFEFLMKEKFQEMLSEKSSECKKLQKDVAGRLSELSDVFSGTTPLVRVEKNDKLKNYFVELKAQIELLIFDDASSSGRKIVHIMSTLDEVQEIYSLDVNAQIRQFILEIRQLMHQLLRTLNMKEDTLVQIQIISDLSYAWEIIDNFTELMQKGIRQNPAMSIKLRATFLKLSSVMDLPLLRIQQANSPDMVSVSQFYSKNLVLYFRRVLQIIPETVFAMLARIVEIRTQSIKELPTRLDKDKMKEYARLDDRYEIARLTHSISVLTEGVLTMKTTLVGIIKVDPKQLLEDGIRKELVKNVSTAMHTTLNFNPKAKQSELVARLQTLSAQIDAYRRSFEYISDYIGLSGLKIWQEEFTRIINYNVEQECNSFLRHKVKEWESLYQSKLIPIPQFAPTDSNFGFVGRLANEILRETDPKNTVYVDHLFTWYDVKTHKEIINVQLFKILLNGFGNIGVAGLDRLYCFMITNHLQIFTQSYKKDVLSSQDFVQFLSTIEKMTEHETKFVDQPLKFYNSLVSKFSKFTSNFCSLLTKIGQIQILRRHLTRELNIACKFESKLYENALRTLNRSVMIDVRSHQEDPTKPYPAEDNPLFFELTSYLDAAGITDSLKKIYISQKMPFAHLPLVVFVLILSQMPKFSLIKSIGLISKKPADAIDGAPFVIGVVTLLRQFGGDSMLKCVAQIGQALKSFVHFSLTNKSQIPSDVFLLLRFLLEFLSYAEIDHSTIHDYVPKCILDENEALAF